MADRVAIGVCVSYDAYESTFRPICVQQVSRITVQRRDKPP